MMPCFIPVFCAALAVSPPVHSAPYSDVGMRVNGSHRAIGGNSYSREPAYYVTDERTGVRYPVYLYPLAE